MFLRNFSRISQNFAKNEIKIWANFSHEFDEISFIKEEKFGFWNKMWVNLLKNSTDLFHGIYSVRITDETINIKPIKRFIFTSLEPSGTASAALLTPPAGKLLNAIRWFVPDDGILRKSDNGPMPLFQRGTSFQSFCFIFSLLADHQVDWLKQHKLIHLKLSK